MGLCGGGLPGKDKYLWYCQLIIDAEGCNSARCMRMPHGTEEHVLWQQAHHRIT
jgi:hypothetical protein